MGGEESAKRGKKNRLSAADTRDIVAKMISLSEKGHPLEFIAKECGISLRQATDIWAKLVRAKKLVPTPPSYRIISVKKKIAELFSEIGVSFEEVKATFGDNGSIIITPYSAS